MHRGIQWPALLTLLVAVALCLCAGPSGAAEPVAQWTLKEHLGHQWRHELVFYPLPEGLTATAAERFRLIDDAGVEIPWQVEIRTTADGSQRAFAGFIIDLPAGATRTFRLVPGKPATVETDLVAQRDGKNWVLGSKRCAVRLPTAEGFKGGTRFGDLPAPILGVRTWTGRWVGEGRLLGKRPVRTFSVEVLSTGPVWADARVTYNFDQRKLYQVDVRAIAGENAVLVSETFRLSKPEYKLTKFHRGPDLAPPLGGKSGLMEWLIWPEYMGTFSVVTDFEKYPTFTFAFMKGWADRAWKFNHTQPVDPKPYLSAPPDKGMMLHPFQPVYIGNRARGIGFYKQGGPEIVGLFYRHLSRWERPAHNAVPLVWREDGITGHFVAFEGRREWGITSAPNKDIFALYKKYKNRPGVLDAKIVKHGETPLDTVKDWVLEWNDPPEAPPHPRVLLTPEKLKQLRRAHGSERDYAAFFDPKEQRTRFDRAMFYLNHMATSFLKCTQSSVNARFHSTQSTMTRSMLDLDLGLALADVTAAERRRARALAAFFGYKQSSPDYWRVREYAHGPSNPNMMDISAASLACTSAVLRGHPAWKRWADIAARVVSASYRASVSDDGVWFESPGYQGAGNRSANIALLALHRHGILDLTEIPQVAKVSTYTAHLLSPPDPRFRSVKPGVKLPEGVKIPAYSYDYTEEHGLTEEQLDKWTVKHRMPAGLGDNVPFHDNFTTWTAGLIKDKHPRAAGHALWQWQQMGRPDRNYREVLRSTLDPTVKPVPIDGTTRFFPGFGVMFRHGFGTPHETFMTFRWTDHARGHYDQDFGSFSLYAKGVPLCLDWPDYASGESDANVDGPRFHNSIDPACVSNKGETKLMEFVSTSGADYTRGRQYIRIQSPEDGSWQRQILFVKDEGDPGRATYFVFRDVFNGNEKNTCNIWTISKKPPTFEGDAVARLQGRFGVDAHIMFFKKPLGKLATERIYHVGISYGRWVQTQHCVRATAQGESHYGFVIYPTRRGEAPPKVFTEKTGVVRVVFAGGEEHCLFLFPDETTVRHGPLAFKGRCGIAKKVNGRWSATLLGGSHLRVEKNMADFE